MDNFYCVVVFDGNKRLILSNFSHKEALLQPFQTKLRSVTLKVQLD